MTIRSEPAPDRIGGRERQGDGIINTLLSIVVDAEKMQNPVVDQKLNLIVEQAVKL